MSRVQGETAAGAVRPQVVALVASLGGLAAFTQILGGLPADFGAPILLLQHMEPAHPSTLPALLSGRTALRVIPAEEGVKLEAGTVYVAPPDRHLTVDSEGRVRLTGAPQANYSRPSADVLLRSVARAYGPAAIGVVCTGGGLDGAAGLAEIAELGGIAIAQDLESSRSFGMPGEAVRLTPATLVLPLTQIAPRLLGLVGAAAGSSTS